MTDPAEGRVQSALAQLQNIAGSVEQRFREGRRVLSFQEYLTLFAADPVRYGRDAPRYVRDMFDFFGTETVLRPWGAQVRFKLFDLPWEPADAATSTSHGRDTALVGHEDLQAETYRALSNFVQEGRANRLVLMHGPNGSAKSTIASCILRALEHYSTLDGGALYRFHWVFPSKKTVRGSIGFGEGKPAEGKPGQSDTLSYAHLEDSQIDARIVMELRDHPLFLLPLVERRELVHQLYRDAGAKEPPPEWLLAGKLSHKSQQVFEALLSSYNGSLVETLRHVQVERYFISRRYRVGAVTIGPQLSVDASERQITADRSLSALPTSLQATTLFEAHGELVEAAGGVLEFSDLLKRPLEHFRYLQLTLETGEVALSQQTIQTNVVMIGSCNEIHLAAFREHPEFPSFRGRFELLRAPYLRAWNDEQKIYDAQIAPFVRRHVAPFATQVAAQFAVLTRMRMPEPKRYSDTLAPIVSQLTALEKMDLYTLGVAPDRLDSDAKKVLVANIAALYHETDSAIVFEGSSGVSPREIRTVLLDAAQSADYACLSPFAVLGELDELCKRTAEYDFLREKQMSGGYHDTRAFRDAVRARLLDSIEDQLRVASGLVDEARYSDLFDRYITNVSVWLKGEKIRNPITGDHENPDERMMREVEGLLGIKVKNDEYRKGLISQIAAWAIDHPGQKIVNQVVFPEQLRKLRDTVFADRKKVLGSIVRDLIGLLRQRTSGEARDAEAGALREEQRKVALAALERLKGMGYCERCALDAATSVLRSRFAEQS